MDFVELLQSFAVLAAKVVVSLSSDLRVLHLTQLVPSVVLPITMFRL
jgi:hypothetical protein